jgi:hypothetical protein
MVCETCMADKHILKSETGARACGLNGGFSYIIYNPSVAYVFFTTNSEQNQIGHMFGQWKLKNKSLSTGLDDWFLFLRNH